MNEIVRIEAQRGDGHCFTITPTWPRSVPTLGPEAHVFVTFQARKDPRVTGQVIASPSPVAVGEDLILDDIPADGPLVAVVEVRASEGPHSRLLGYGLSNLIPESSASTEVGMFFPVQPVPHRHAA